MAVVASREDVSASRLWRAYRQVRLAQELARGEGRSVIELAAKSAGDDVHAVISDLVAHGADKEVGIPERGSLQELMVLDSPSSRALLDGLKALVPLARAVDQERGNVLETALS